MGPSISNRSSETDSDRRSVTARAALQVGSAKPDRGTIRSPAYIYTTFLARLILPRPKSNLGLPVPAVRFARPVPLPPLWNSAPKPGNARRRMEAVPHQWASAEPSVLVVVFQPNLPPAAQTLLWPGANLLQWGETSKRAVFGAIRCWRSHDKHARLPPVDARIPRRRIR